MKRIYIIILAAILCSFWAGGVLFGGLEMPGNNSPRYGFNSLFAKYFQIYRSGAFHRVVDIDSTDLLYTPLTRGLTINGVTQDLSSNRTWTITAGVSSFNSRAGAISPLSADYSAFYPLQNGTGATGTWGIGVTGNAGTVTNGVYTTTFNSLGDARYPLMAGAYTNPAWITSIPYSKITGAPINVSSFTNDAGYLVNSTGDARYPVLIGAYANPAWLTSLPYSKITGAPNNVSAFINDAGYLVNGTGDARYQPLENQRGSTGSAVTFYSINTGLMTYGAVNLAGYTIPSSFYTGGTGKSFTGWNYSSGGGEIDHFSYLGSAGTVGGYRWYSVNTSGVATLMLDLNGTSNIATFPVSPVVPTPTFGTQAANKDYVDTHTSGINTAQTTVSGSVSGFIVASQPFQGSTFKKVLIYYQALNGTATYTFPVAFSFVPAFTAGGSISTTLTTTSITINNPTTTGWIILEGY